MPARRPARPRRYLKLSNHRMGLSSIGIDISINTEKSHCRKAPKLIRCCIPRFRDSLNSLDFLTEVPMTPTRRMPTLWISLLVFLSFFVSSTGFGQSLRPDGQTVQAQSEERPGAAPSFHVMTHPTERHLQRGRPFNGDVRTLPQTRPVKIERPEFEEPEITPVPYPG